MSEISVSEYEQTEITDHKTEPEEERTSSSPAQQSASQSLSRWSQVYLGRTRSSSKEGSSLTVDQFSWDDTSTCTFSGPEYQWRVNNYHSFSSWIGEKWRITRSKDAASFYYLITSLKTSLMSSCSMIENIDRSRTWQTYHYCCVNKYIGLRTALLIEKVSIACII
jgi:hypothetical protein